MADGTDVRAMGVVVVRLVIDECKLVAKSIELGVVGELEIVVIKLVVEVGKVDVAVSDFSGIKPANKTKLLGRNF